MPSFRVRGPLRNGKALEAGRITEGEVDMLRRILYAFGGDGHVAVTRDEADILFDIDEAVRARGTQSGLDRPVRQGGCQRHDVGVGLLRCRRAKRLCARKRPLHDPDQQTSVLASLLSMVQSNLASVQDAYHDQTAEERALARLEHQRIEIITNEAITRSRGVVARRPPRTRRTAVASETALVAYLKQESPRHSPDAASTPSTGSGKRLERRFSGDRG